MDHPVSIIGAGAWGTALALILANKNIPVKLWEYFPDYAKELQNSRVNHKFLPGITIPDNVMITNKLKEAAQDCPIITLAVPSQSLRSVTRQLGQLEILPKIIITASKGIEKTSLARMSEIITEQFSEKADIGVLSGPSHAEEVARQLPCTVVAASNREIAAKEIQRLFTNDRFRVYTSTDMAGVELGGALKNVIALAAGVVDGLGLGDNAKAALMTRGLVEIARLGTACGALPETFAGLSGMGDLIVTCTSTHSRNRRVGEEIGRGRSLEEILDNMEMVAEGVETTKSAQALGERYQVELPIINQVYQLLFENKSPLEAVNLLMQRPYKSEV